MPGWRRAPPPQVPRGFVAMQSCRANGVMVAANSDPGGTFSATFCFLRFAQGKFVAITKVMRNIVVDDSGSKCSGFSVAELYDKNGKLLVRRYPANTRAAVAGWNGLICRAKGRGLAQALGNASGCR